MLKKIVLLSLFVLGLASLGCQKEAQEDPKPVTVIDSVASTDDVMIHYEARGAGDRAVVFVHGWCGNRTYWIRQVEAFEDEYRVVAIDLAGYGQSGKNRDNWTIEMFGEDVAAVVQALDLKKVILVGHSMGGPVNVEAARRLPERTVALIGVDTYQKFAPPLSSDEAEAWIGPFRTDFVESTKGFVTDIFGPNADSTLVAEVVDDMCTCDSIVGVACFEAYSAYDITAALKEMRKPIRAVNADLWPTDIENNDSLAESFKVTILKGFGHFPHLEDPGKFNLELRRTIHEFWPPTT